MLPAFFVPVFRWIFARMLCLLLPAVIFTPSRPATGAPELQADRQNKDLQNEIA